MVGEDEMETLSEAMSRLRSDGYVEDWHARPGGLRCGECHQVHSPDDVSVDHIARFEGTSDPGDASMLFALAGPCGHKGLYVVAYGADTAPDDVAVVQALPDRLPD